MNAYAGMLRLAAQGISVSVHKHKQYSHLMQIYKKHISTQRGTPLAVSGARTGSFLAHLSGLLRGCDWCIGRVSLGWAGSSVLLLHGWAARHGCMIAWV